MSINFTSKKLSVLIISSITFFSLSFLSLNTFAQSERDAPEAILDSEAKEVIQNIENVDIQNPDKIDLKIKGSKVVSEQGELTNEFDLKDKTISLEDEEGDLDLEIKIPEPEEVDDVILDNDQIIFSNQDEDYDTVVENIDGGVRQVINIESRKAPSEYEFEMDLADGDFLEKQVDGSAVIKDKNGEIKTTIFKPWAKDANGTELETFYEIESSTLIQKINLESENVAFPIVADPIWCGNAIRSVRWINRGGVYSASVYPTWCGAWGGGGFQWGAWSEMVSKTPNSRHWDKKYNTSTYWSMYNQYFCHADWAGGAKTPWNLEPSRRDKGYWGFIARACN